MLIWLTFLQRKKDACEVASVFVLARILTIQKVLPQDDEKSSASSQRQATHTGKSQGTAIPVEDAVIIIRGLNLCSVHFNS
jgi:hypothetical protein